VRQSSAKLLPRLAASPRPILLNNRTIKCNTMHFHLPPVYCYTVESSSTRVAVLAWRRLMADRETKTSVFTLRNSPHLMHSTRLNNAVATCVFMLILTPVGSEWSLTDCDHSLKMSVVAMIIVSPTFPLLGLLNRASGLSDHSEFPTVISWALDDSGNFWHCAALLNRKAD